MSRHVDVLIIGSGAGGSTLAHRLAPSGTSVLVLERGDFVPREKDNWSAEAVFLDGKYLPDEQWQDKDGEPFQPQTHYNVGGNTKFYGAALFRLREADFGEIHHADGVSPAWPLSYTDYRSYYSEAEALYSVHGLRGSDPTEPPESDPYPHAPLAHEPRIQQLYDDLEGLGHRPFPLPMGVRLPTDGAQPAAPYVIENFDGFPDPTELKADAHVSALLPALAHPNVTLETNSLVERLTTDASGRTVTGVHVRRGEESEVISADIVVVACGAVNSAALLLRSHSDRHPDGLANASGVVGRHFMFHNNSALMALSTEPNPTRFGKTLALNDFYHDDGEGGGPLGHIQMLGKTREAMIESKSPVPIPGFSAQMVADHALDFWLTTEDLPLPENRVTLRPDGTIRLSYTRTNLSAHDRLKGKLKGLLKSIRCDDHLIPNELYFGQRIPLAGVAHQNGTVRFGHDPRTSALDTDCKAHDLDNLYVVDGSFFCSSSAVNPSLTISANALRVGDHLLDRLGASAASGPPSSKAA